MTSGEQQSIPRSPELGTYMKSLEIRSTSLFSFRAAAASSGLSAKATTARVILSKMPLLVIEQEWAYQVNTNPFHAYFNKYRIQYVQVTYICFLGRSIDIGFVEGEGYTADNEAAADFVRRQGLTSYRLQEFLVTVEEAIKRPVGATPAEAQLLCGISRADPASSSQEATLQRPDLKFSHIWKKGAASQDQRTSATSAGQIDVQARLRSCTSAPEASEMILQAIKAKLARLLAVPAEDILVDRSVASHGMDSLVAVELRNWILAFLEAHVQTFELMSPMSFTNLALLIANRSHLILPRVFAEET